MVSPTSNNTSHYDLTVAAVEPDAAENVPEWTGLYHVSFKIGNSTEDLKRAKESLEKVGVSIDCLIDHEVSQFIHLCLTDPNVTGTT